MRPSVWSPEDVLGNGVHISQYGYWWDAKTLRTCMHPMGWDSHQCPVAIICMSVHPATTAELFDVWTQIQIGTGMHQQFIVAEILKTPKG